jgi:peptidoglycan hydrolase-like protein with peptidoglycan-binding domain
MEKPRLQLFQLMKSHGTFNKTYDDFIKQFFSSNVGVKSLYNFLINTPIPSTDNTEKKFYYTKPLSDFYDVFSCDLPFAIDTIYCGGTGDPFPKTNITPKTNNTIEMNPFKVKSMIDKFPACVRFSPPQPGVSGQVFIAGTGENQGRFFFNNGRYKEKDGAMGDYVCTNDGKLLLTPGKVVKPTKPKTPPVAPPVIPNVTPEEKEKPVTPPQIYHEVPFTGDEISKGAIVKYGDRGEIVGEIQNQLLAASKTLQDPAIGNISDTNTVDKIYGPKTTNAVKVFQSKSGLTPDGKVGPLTWGKLNPTTTTQPITQNDNANFEMGNTNKSELEKEIGSTTTSPIVNEAINKIKLNMKKLDEQLNRRGVDQIPNNIDKFRDDSVNTNNEPKAPEPKWGNQITNNPWANKNPVSQPPVQNSQQKPTAPIAPPPTAKVPEPKWGNQNKNSLTNNSMNPPVNPNLVPNSPIKQSTQPVSPQTPAQSTPVPTSMFTPININAEQISSGMSVVKPGTEGNIVNTIQGLLNSASSKLGNPEMGNIIVDGKFGPKTKKALEIFQHTSGLPSDGIVGKYTWAKLNSVQPKISSPEIQNYSGENRPDEFNTQQETSPIQDSPELSPKELSYKQKNLNESIKNMKKLMI